MTFVTSFFSQVFPCKREYSIARMAQGLFFLREIKLNVQIKACFTMFNMVWVKKSGRQYSNSSRRNSDEKSRVGHSVIQTQLYT